MKNLSLAAIQKADKIGEAILQVLQGTSVQYAATYKGEVIASGSVGKYDLAGSRPLSKDDMYGIGSVSKVYVVASAMMLVDRGLLDIDRPYKHYVPEFEMADPRYQTITVRHLMNHSSGIFGTHFKGGFLFEDPDTFAHDNLLALLKNNRLKYDPGTFSEYCNDGFQLLEILVERLSGMAYNEFLSTQIFEPLGIKNTKTPLDSYDRTRMARSAILKVYEGELPYETTNLIGTGGVVSTAEDLCAFGQVLMGKQLLSEKSARMMGEKEYALSAYWPKDDEPDNLFAYGLGFDHVHVPPFDKVGYQALCKGGDTMQYHASLVVIPALDLAAAAVSAGGASFADYALVVELLKDACIELELVDAFPPVKTYEAPVKQEMPAELLKYAGLYAENGKFAEIAITDGEIALEGLLGGMIPPQKYVYAGEGRFVSPDGKCAVHFFDAAGGLTFLQGDIMIELPGIGSILWKAFLYQRLEKNAVDAASLDAWRARDGKKYILANDLHSSMNLLVLSEPAVVEMKVNADYGYVAGGGRIVDQNHAENVLVFRDILDYTVHTEDGVEYLSGRGYVFIDSVAIPALAAERTSVAIGQNGYAQFFMVDGATAGKTLTVKAPATGTFAAYGEKKDPAPPALKALTSVMGDKPVALESGDMLLFVGSVGDLFEIELK